MRRSASNGLPARERGARSSRYSVRVMRVSVVVVVCVANDVGIVNHRIANVDPVPIPVSRVVPRMERFAKAQREPADTEPYAESKSDASAEEADERRTIDRDAESRPWVPAPPAADVAPAAIVKRSKAPRRIVNPSPAPGSNVAPITVAVRSPIGSHFRRVPDRPVGAILAPSAVVIEILGSGHVFGNVAFRDGILFAQVAFIRPVVESIRLRCLRRNRGLHIIRAVEDSVLTRL